MLQSIDLNLLPVLDRLLATQSVTAAARDVGLSVPAASRALNRLRLLLDDPILVRAGRRLVLTARARHLAEPLAVALSGLQAAITPADPIDPARMKRTFGIACDDIVAAALAPRLLKRAAACAPQVRFRFLPEDVHGREGVRSEEVDLELGGARPLPPETRIQHLYWERLVFLLRTDHPWLQGRKTLKRFSTYPHVIAALQQDFEPTLADAFKQGGLTREVGLVMPSLYGAAVAARSSDLIACAPGIIACQLSKMLGLAVAEPPLPLPAFSARMAWHPRHHSDGTHQWLRREVTGVVLDIGAREWQQGA